LVWIVIHTRILEEVGRLIVEEIFWNDIREKEPEDNTEVYCFQNSFEADVDNI